VAPLLLNQKATGRVQHGDRANVHGATEQVAEQHGNTNAEPARPHSKSLRAVIAPPRRVRLWRRVILPPVPVPSRNNRTSLDERRLDSVVALDMKEAVMTDPRNYDYVRRGEALGAVWGWVLGIGAAVVIALLVIVSYSNPTDTNTASNSAPNTTSNSPPRIPPSTTGSGAQPEQPAQSKPGG
jgi:hypothetical protein